MIIVSNVLISIGVFLSLYVAHWLFLLLNRLSFTRQELYQHQAMTRFAVIIPAHNEELLLPRMIESVRRQDYPHGLFSILVIADNCTDYTANIARQNGAMVLERFDKVKKGKGYAIQWALGMFKIDHYDAVFIVDADCVMSGSSLRELDFMIQGGKQVIQCYSGIENADDSWFTRLLDVSTTLSNELYHPAKQMLGLSSTLMGTGMCFTTEILRRYGWDAFSVGEDWEYYAKLMLNGEIIGYSYGARIYHRESSSLKQATSQRMRWSSGRFAIAWKYGPRLLLRGLIERNIVKFEAALPLVFPNPSLGANITLIGMATSLSLPLIHKGALQAWFLALILIQAGIFVMGVFFTRNKLRKFLSIFIAPVFLVWKMAIDMLSAMGMGRKKWVRTERKL